jgi:hypothetical protein
MWYLPHVIDVQVLNPNWAGELLGVKSFWPSWP